MDVLGAITSQVAAAQEDLRAYRPDSVDWDTRALATAAGLVPWLVQVAPALKDYVQDVLNAPALLRSLWATIRRHVSLPREQVEAFDRQLSLDDVLRESVTGEVVSNVVSKYLIEHHPDFGAPLQRPQRLPRPVPLRPRLLGAAANSRGRGRRAEDDSTVRP